MMPTAPTSLPAPTDTHSQMSKSISRILQHSILQLCNEHISYNHKLQILGVLCITVDGKEQETVIKVNNTLKRVNSTGRTKETSPHVPQAFPTAQATAASPYQAGYSEAVNLSGGVSQSMEQPTAQTPPPSLLFPVPPRSSSPDARKGHGRKGANPVKVHHVYDEGELISKEEDDENIITVIPTDPDAADVAPIASSSQNIGGSSSKMSTSVTAQRSGEKRKNGAQYQMPSQKAEIDDDTPPTIRALLLAGPRNNVPVNETAKSPSDEQLSPGSRAGLALPLVISPDGASQCRDITSEDGALDFSTGRKHDKEMDSESNDDESYPVTPNQGTPGMYAENGRMENGMSHYSSMYGMSPPTYDTGMSVHYTNTGPITVGANGKNVSQSTLQKVKDIILYDDSSSPASQKGSRIETGDYMLDSFGLEGSGGATNRKRRRRSPDEALTNEEIAEYLGFSPGLSTSTFTCRYCNEELQELSKYLQHTLAVHNAYICHQCGKSFTTKSSLLRHRPIHTGLRRFACSICKKTFYRKDKCKAHIKRHLGVNSDPDSIERYQKTEPIE